jgi:hypothetical protein
MISAEAALLARGIYWFSGSDHEHVFTLLAG